MGTKEWGPHHTATVRTGARLAEVLIEQDRDAEAKALHRQALEVEEKTLGPTHPEVAYVLDMLGRLAGKAGDHLAAEDFHRRALAISERKGENEAGAWSRNALARTMAQRATDLSNQGKLAEAEGLYEQAQQLAIQARGPRSVDVAIILTRLAWLKCDRGSFSDAERLGREAYDILLEANAPAEFVAAAVQSVADTLQETARFHEAEDLYLRAIDLSQQIGDAQPWATRLCRELVGLADLYVRLGHFREARARFEESLRVASAVDGDQEAIALGRLATLERAQSKFGEAVRLTIDALAKQHDQDTHWWLVELRATVEEDLGRYSEAERFYHVLIDQASPGDVNLPSALEGLAGLLVRVGRYAEADRLGARALALLEGQLGPAHPDLVRLLEILADARDWQGRCQEAQDLLRRAIAVAETSLGPTHPTVAAALSRLGTFDDWHPSSHEEAQGLLERALHIYENQFGPLHPSVAWAVARLADLIRDERPKDAQSLYERAVAILDRAYGTEYADATSLLVDLAGLVVDQGDLARGEALLNRARVVAGANLGPAHPDLAHVLTGIGHAHGHAGRIEMAFAAYEQSLRILEAAFGAEYPGLVNYLDPYAQDLEEAGRAVDAARVKARADRLRIRHVKVASSAGAAPA